MIIYKATNVINGKAYIGKTNGTLADRIKTHKYNSGKKDWLFYRAIRKYGFSSFTWNIICECVSQTELDCKEKDYILINAGGYNIAKGGSGGDTFTNNPNKEKLRENVSKFHKGKILSEEHKKKISMVHINKKKPWAKITVKKMVQGNIGKPSKLKGVPLSEETKRKISEGNIGKKKIFTIEHKQSLSEAQKKRFKINNPLKGKSYIELYGEEKANEMKKKQSELRKGRIVTEETRNKISKNHKSKK